MEAKITKTNENKLFSRQEVSAAISFGKSTPTRKEMRELVSAKIGANPETVILRAVKSKFGTREVNAVFHIYATKEKMAEAEPYYLLVRDGMAKKKEKKPKQKTAPPAKKK